MVGTRVGFRAGIALASGQARLLIVIVDATEIAGIQTNLIGQLNSGTQADAVAVAGKRRVLLVVVRNTVVGTLHAAGECPAVVDITLDTSQELVRAVG